MSSGGMLMGGTLTLAVASAIWISTPSGWNVWVEAAAACTLLGPEGPGRRLRVVDGLSDQVGAGCAGEGLVPPVR